MLELKGISKSYKRDWLRRRDAALSDLNLSFPEGGVSLLLGPNGAGKTTAIRIILGLVFADQGQVLLHGKPLDQQMRANIGYMPEVASLPSKLSSRELLTMQGQLYPQLQGNGRRLAARIDEQLAEVGLEEEQGKLIGELSKGMGRRLSWALATLHEPSHLILDEPFSGLDPIGRRLLLGAIDTMAAAGKTIILCHHELAYLPQHCHQLYVLKQGRLVYQRSLTSTNSTTNSTNSPSSAMMGGQAAVSEDEVVSFY